MKALALDTSISCIQIAAKNDDKLASLVLDIGMRQSEKLLPAIDYVLKQAELAPAELDYTALCQGPGSFTGLRLGFAALKAIELFGGTAGANGELLQAQDTPLSDQEASQDQEAQKNENFLKDQNAGRSRIPLYGINSLDFLAQPFMELPAIVLPIIDAHKDKFYAKAFFNGKEIVPCDDWELGALEEKIEGFAGSDTILVCGLEAQVFADACKQNGLFKDKKIVASKGRSANIESLFILAEEKIARNEPPLADYDGPQYYRASEAEQKSAN